MSIICAPAGILAVIAAETAMITIPALPTSKMVESLARPDPNGHLAVLLPRGVELEAFAAGLQDDEGCI